MFTEANAGPDPKAHMDRLIQMVAQRQGGGQTLDEVMADMPEDNGDIFLAWHAALVLNGGTD